MMHYGYGYGMGLWGGFGWLFQFLFMVLIVVAIVYLVRAVYGGRSGPRHPDQDALPPREDSALRILRERYARGEIDRDEFEQRKRDLA